VTDLILDDDVVDAPEERSPMDSVRFLSLEMKNFLSYKDSTLDFGSFVALVGPNASGKSNAVAAIRLLTEIRAFGLPVAINRRGGYDQLRHRSSGHPYDPTLTLRFELEGSLASFYELSLGSIEGGRYRVKREQAVVYLGRNKFEFSSDGKTVLVRDQEEGQQRRSIVAGGQSAISTSGSVAGFVVFDVLGRIQTLDVNPKSVGELQEPSSVSEFLPDGSNVASIFEDLSQQERREVVEDLAAIVPGIARIEVPHLADKLTLRFWQATDKGTRKFLAKQMSDGTLRMFAVLLAAHRSGKSGLLVIEEPEVAVHLGAMRTLTEIVMARCAQAQVLVTTHSADIVNAIAVDSLRVVWTEAGASRIAHVASHTRETIQSSLMTPGELLSADLLDPAQ
jgi:predicted ATPase